MKHLAISLLFCGVAAAQQTLNPPPKPVHSFNDKTNLALWSADMLVRTLDWRSTETFLANPCKCIHEAELPLGIVNHSGRMFAYGLAVAGAVHGVAYIAHKTGHHKIERIIPLFDIAADGYAVAGNYTAIAQH